MIYIFSFDTRNNGILRNTLNSTNVIDYSHKNSYDFISSLRHFKCSKGDDGGRRGEGVGPSCRWVVLEAFRGSPLVSDKTKTIKTLVIIWMLINSAHNWITVEKSDIIPVTASELYVVNFKPIYNRLSHLGSAGHQWVEDNSRSAPECCDKSSAS